MEKIAETFQVDTSGRHPETGEKIEPEQAPAAQVTEVIPDMRMQTPSGLLENGQPVSSLGTMPASFAVEAPAGVLAMNLKSQCERCTYWSHETWLRIKAGLERGITASSHSQLERYRNEVRFMLADGPETSAFDPDQYENTERAVDRHLASMGVCHALCELMANVPEEAGGGVQLTFPSGGCPIGMTIPGVGETVGDMFRPRDSENEKKASIAYDELLLLAARKSRA